MQIILIYKNGGNGQVAFSADRFLQAPDRHYDIVDGVTTLAGYPDDILHHDADELLAGDDYRMPTLQEQEAMAQAEQQISMAQETDVTPSDPEPPAQETSKKKASGG